MPGFHFCFVIIFFVYVTFLLKDKKVFLFRRRIRKKNLRHSIVRECNGIMPVKQCPHYKQKAHCQICNPTGFCAHNRARNTCVECGGQGICEHKRRRYLCTECGGTGICEHGRRRTRCKECGGKEICEHGARRSICKVCCGSGICVHKKQRQSCRDCGGASICEHGRGRYACKECSGTGICEHKKIRRECKDCGGSSICKHGRQRAGCRDCGGASICAHGLRRTRCKDCGGSALCQTPLCEAEYRTKYKPYCRRCFIFLNPDAPQARNFKTKELAVRDFIMASFPGISWAHDKRVPGGSSLRRPDLMADFGTHALFIEIEENGHDFGYNCTTKRVTELWEDVRQRPSYFLRFNPDSCITEGGNKLASCWKKNAKGFSIVKDVDAWKQRLEILACVVKHHIHTIPEKLIQITQLFFSPPLDDDEDESKT